MPGWDPETSCVKPLAVVDGSYTSCCGLGQCNSPIKLYFPQRGVNHLALLTDIVPRKYNQAVMHQANGNVSPNISTFLGWYMYIKA